MLEYVRFEAVAGERTEPDLKLLLLTTCAHCERAIAYLTSHGFTFGTVYADELPLELKKRLVLDFHRAFHTRVYYPSLIVDNRDVLLGFERLEWDRVLGAWLDGRPEREIAR